MTTKLTLALSGIVLAAACSLPVYAADTPTTVTCTDGTSSAGGRGACSGHGGISKSSSAPAAAPAKPAAPAAAPAAAAKPAAPAATATPAAPAAAAKPAAAAPKAASNTDPTGATAKCKDGTYSHAKSHSGACSKHGGVGDWLDGTATK